MTDVFAHGTIRIRGAYENNLKNVSVDIPKNRLVVLTGLSGSGKSSLAYDTLMKECVRQYMESLGMITFFISKPKVQSITGLSPSISVDQVKVNRNPRSTVGTTTDVYTYLRVLYARLGERDCPKCGKRVLPPREGEVEEEGYFSCPHCKGPVPHMSMAHFSFNTPEGACEMCTGLGIVYGANIPKLVDEEKSIILGAVKEWNKFMISWNLEVLTSAASHYGFIFDLSKPIKELSQFERDLLYYGVLDKRFTRHFPNVKPPETVRAGKFEGVATRFLRRYGEHLENEDYFEKMEDSVIKKVCPVCDGTRLKKYNNRVTVLGDDISSLSRLAFSDLLRWVKKLNDLPQEAFRIARPIVADLDDRISRLIDVGLGYLSMDRPSTSLSGGEYQRIRLASLLGSGLTGVLYVLDEPTTGLHPRDTGRLIKVLKRLRDLGNTVLVIEHDHDFILNADYVIDMGPGAGRDGGHIIATGTPEEILKNPNSVTGKTLRLKGPVQETKILRKPLGEIIIKGAREHNLKDITVSIPTGTFTAITGVTGSGKSTLIFDVLEKAAKNKFDRSCRQAGKHDEIIGLDGFKKVVSVVQAPIARTVKSNTATYIDIFTPIRNLFASTKSAKKAGLTPGHFSFNLPGGRCERCKGLGVVQLDMHFLRKIETTCPECKGRRFMKPVLSVKYKGYDISQVLSLTVEEAYELFSDETNIHSRLKVLVEVGMGYLTLGQSATTLSGGEAQRLKLAKELGRTGKGPTLYLLDEPTMGLHAADVHRLLMLLNRLVDGKNTVCVIEHNLDVIASADWVIDLGPEGGQFGGELVAEGTPLDIAIVEGSYTGQCLRVLFEKGRL
jgi:excinuclease ABC subunit A